jgi:hypothetical protein
MHFDAGCALMFLLMALLFEYSLLIGLDPLRNISFWCFDLFLPSFGRLTRRAFCHFTPFHLTWCMVNRRLLAKALHPPILLQLLQRVYLIMPKPIYVVPDGICNSCSWRFQS